MFSILSLTYSGTNNVFYFTFQMFNKITTSELQHFRCSEELKLTDHSFMYLGIVSHVPTLPNISWETLGLCLTNTWLYSLEYNWIWIKYTDLFSDENFFIMKHTNQQNHPKRNHMFLFQHLQRKTYHNLQWSCQ